MSTIEPPPIVGLTGGIASGKTTVSEMFRELGVRVIDADAIAREIVEPGEEALDEIRREFGEEVVDAEGRLDREALGERIFQDDEARQTLEAITHPRIAERMLEKARSAGAAGADWVVYDAALIVENDLQDAFAGLIVVAARPEVQIERIVERDAIDEEAARARLDAQMPLAEKIAVADYVVDNDGSLEATRRQVDRLYEVIDRGIREVGTAERDVLERQGIVDDDFLTPPSYSDVQA